MSQTLANQFTCIILFNPYNNSVKRTVSLSPFDERKKMDSERLTTLNQVIQLMSYGEKTQITDINVKPKTIKLLERIIRNY